MTEDDINFITIWVFVGSDSGFDTINLKNDGSTVGSTSVSSTGWLSVNWTNPSNVGTLSGEFVSSTSGSAIDAWYIEVDHEGSTAVTTDNFLDGTVHNTQSDTGGHVKLGHRNGTDTDGLAGYWRLESESGYVLDYSGNGVNGTVNSSIQRGADGVFNTSAMTNDGTGRAAVQIPADDAVNPDAAITVSLWVKVDNQRNDFMAFADNDYNDRWYVGTADGMQDFRFVLAPDNNDCTNTYCVQEGEKSFNLDQWYHVAFTYDATTTKWKRYVNGEKIGTTNISGCNGASCHLSADKLEICLMDSEPCLASADNPNPLNGTVDEVRVYSRALSEDEIARLYDRSPGYYTTEWSTASGSNGRGSWDWFNWAGTRELGTDVEGRVHSASGVNKTETRDEWADGTFAASAGDGLIGYYPLEQQVAEGAAVRDWSGNTNDATRLAPGLDAGVEGVIPQSNAFMFPGENTDDYVNLTEATKPTGTQPFAVSMWFKLAEKPTDASNDRGLFGGRGLGAPNNAGGAALTFYSGLDPAGLYFDLYDGNDRSRALEQREWKVDRWYHAVATWDGTNNQDGQDLWIDGEKVSDSGDNPIDELNWSDTSLWAFGNSNFNPFNGTIDDVRIYHGNLSDAEIRSQYTTMSYTSQWQPWEDHDEGVPTPQSWWKIGEGAGQWVNDSVRDMAGTVGRDTVYRSHDPTWQHDCRRDGCLRLDGDDDVVQIDYGSTMNTTLNNEVWSMSFYFKPVDPVNGSNWRDFVKIFAEEDGAFRIEQNGGSTGRLSTYWSTDSGNPGNNPATKLCDFTGLSDPQWYHLTLTLDKSGDGSRCYVNGVQTDSTSSGDLTAFDDVVGPMELPSETGKEWLVDDFRFFDQALAEDDVRSVVYGPGMPFINWDTQGGQPLEPYSHWTLDEGIGQKAYDRGNEENDGDLGGSTSAESSDPTWTKDCRFDGCLSFDGSDDYLHIGQTPAVNLTTKEEYTISAWAKLRHNSEDKTVVGYGSGEVGLGYDVGTDQWYHFVDTSGTGDYAYGWFTQANAEIDKWVHLVGRYNGTHVAVFVNGKKGDRVDAASDINDEAHELNVGRNGNSVRYWNGTIDDVRIYNRSLSDQAVTALYNAPDSASQPSSMQVRTSQFDFKNENSLVGAWSFEGTGQFVQDWSGSGNTGTMGVDSDQASNDPMRTAGYSGQAVDMGKFGGDTWVEVSNMNDLPQTEITISAWVKPREHQGFGSVVQNNWQTDGSYNIYTDSSGFHSFGIGNATGSNFIAYGPSLAVDRWHHIAGVYNTTHALFYVDGSLEGQEVVEDTGKTLTTNDRIVIGDDDGGGYNGTIDEVMMFNRSLSQAELRQLYNTSDFTSGVADNYGAYVQPDNTNKDGNNFTEKFYQYKLNLLTGDQRSLPQVDAVKVGMDASAWSPWFNESGTQERLRVEPRRYGQSQFNLSTTNEPNSSMVTQSTIQYTCMPPFTGDWIIDGNCPVNRTVSPPANVEVQDGGTMDVLFNGAVSFDFQNNYLLIRNLGKVLLDKAAKLY